MNKCSILFIGLDTHKTFTQLAVLKDERGAKPESFGKIIPTRLPSLSLLGNYNPNTLKQHCILFMKQALAVIGFTDC